MCLQNVFDQKWLVAEIKKVMKKWTKVRFFGESKDLDLLLEPPQFGRTWYVVEEGPGIHDVEAAMAAGGIIPKGVTAHAYDEIGSDDEDGDDGDGDDDDGDGDGGDNDDDDDRQSEVF